MSKKIVEDFHKYSVIRKWLMNEKNTYEHDLIIMDFARKNIKNSTWLSMLEDIFSFKPIWLYSSDITIDQLTDQELQELRSGHV